MVIYSSISKYNWWSDLVDKQILEHVWNIQEHGKRVALNRY